MSTPHQASQQTLGSPDHSAAVAHFPGHLSLRAVESGNAPYAVCGVDGAAIERKLKNIIKHRRARQAHFPKEMFADPAWDMLLTLALAEQQHRRVSVSMLCVGAQVPTTTALRWINHMTEDEWLIRIGDQHDARRTFIKLSQKASSKMSDFIAGLDEGPST